MNLFAHMIFRQKHTDVKIIRKGDRLRIEVDGVAGERCVMEIEHVGELTMKGLNSGQHAESN